jgi:hypothetical protein
MMNRKFDQELEDNMAKEVEHLSGDFYYRGARIDESWSKPALLNALKFVNEMAMDRQRENELDSSMERMFASAQRRSGGLLARLGFVVAIALLCVSTASAWDYIPIEQSRSYNAYRGPYYGGYYYPRPVYVGPAYPRYGAMPPLRIHESYNYRTGETWQGFSW